jgi:hypothetical protein
MGKTSQIKKLEGVINGLVRELEQLAPHPDHHFSPVAIVRIGQTQSITGNFNQSGLAMQAYLQDVPRRLGLERRLRAARRRLAYYRDYSYADNFALAAA